jgi:hypothetical protein
VKQKFNIHVVTLLLSMLSISWWRVNYNCEDFTLCHYLIVKTDMTCQIYVHCHLINSIFIDPLHFVLKCQIYVYCHLSILMETHPYFLLKCQFYVHSHLGNLMDTNPYFHLKCQFYEHCHLSILMDMDPYFLLKCQFYVCCHLSILMDTDVKYQI